MNRTYDHTYESRREMAGRIYDLDAEVYRILGSGLGRVFNGERERTVRELAEMMATPTKIHYLRSEIALIGNMARTIPDRGERARVMGQYNKILKWVESLPNFFGEEDILDEQIARMNEAGQCLTGKHNFASFMAAGSKITDPTRTITGLRVERLDEGMIGLRVSADGFLYNMVRIITGTLWEFGTRGTPAKKMREILAGEDRALAGKTAPACGLYLESVEYPAEYGIRWLCE